MPWWSVVELLGTNLATLQDFIQKQWNSVKLGSSCASSITNLCSRPSAYRPWMFVKVAHKARPCENHHIGRTILRLDERPSEGLARDQGPGFSKLSGRHRFDPSILEWPQNAHNRKTCIDRSCNLKLKLHLVTGPNATILYILYDIWYMCNIIQYSPIVSAPDINDLQFISKHSLSDLCISCRKSFVHCLVHWSRPHRSDIFSRIFCTRSNCGGLGKRSLPCKHVIFSWGCH